MSKIVFDNKNRKGKANFKTQKYGGHISPKPYLALLCIGHFQSIKTDVLQIFSFISGDKTEFLSPMMFSN